MSSILFYFFASILIVMAIASVTLKNPIHAVLSLISAFVSAAALFFMIGAEYLGAITIVVYVGAVTVLFLFVVMMLGNSEAKATDAKQHVGVVGLSIIASGSVIAYYFVTAFSQSSDFLATTDVVNAGENTSEIGKVLYSEYLVPFQMSGVLLLVAMIGAIMLTLKHKKDVKRQNVATQLSRKGCVTLVDPGKGHGVSI